jgi:hypothetical protein
VHTVLVEAAPSPYQLVVHIRQPRRCLRGCRPRITRTPSRVQAAARSNTTHAHSPLFQSRSQPRAPACTRPARTHFTCTCPGPQSHSPTNSACVRRLHASHAGHREFSVLVVSSCRGTWGGLLRVMQVQAHSITARRPRLVCVGTGGGNPSPGRARRPPVAVPPSSGAWGGCRVSGQRLSASDPGAAARGEAEPTKQSAAPQLATAATRSLQPPPRPPPAPRRAGRPPHHL